MKLAFTMAPERGATDLLLTRFAAELAGKGHAVLGTVQSNIERASGPCDMDVQVLPDGPVLRISQSLGAASSGCRLDPAALETAVGLVGAGLHKGADLLIVNKFGKHEADGRGFRTVIADALERDIPVLVGVNTLNLSAFHAFAGADARRLDPHEGALLSWFDKVRTEARRAA